MPIRIPWDRYEVALLFRAYEQVANGSDVSAEAEKLSVLLRELAIRRGISIDETYRNINGMKMQLANVQYLFTDGRKGLSGASAAIRQMYEQYKTDQAEYKAILKEAIRLTGLSTSIEDAFFAYAKNKIGFPPRMLADYLKKAESYCRLKQPLLGMTDVMAVRKVQQKIAEGKFLRFLFGKDAQTIQNVTQLYYNFVKGYREDKNPPMVRSTLMPEKPAIEKTSSDQKNEHIEPIFEEKGEAIAEKQDTEAAKPVPAALDTTANGEAEAEKPCVESIPDSTDNTSYYNTENDHAVSSEAQNEEWIIAQLKCKGISYQDKRSWEGCLWIVGGHELDAFAQTCKAHGYTLFFKPDGCKTYPERPVWWTKDYEKKQANTADFRRTLDDGFKFFLLSEKQLAERTATQYSQSIEAVECFLLEKEPGITLDVTDSEEVQRIYNALMAREDFTAWNSQRHHQYSAAMAQYIAYLRQGEPVVDETSGIRNHLKLQSEPETTADERWLPVLRESFPDGYILNDFLSRFQANAFWQERYKEPCPVEGAFIDDAMKAIGIVRDGRVFAQSEENRRLIAAICAEINGILSRFTTVYRISIYERYQAQLAACQIYTEQVMTQQLLAEAKGSFYSVSQVFAKHGQYASVIQDCRKVLRNHGGAMPVSDVARELWFIPYDTVYHYLSVDDEALNIGNSVWMMAEHFPLTKEDAVRIGDTLDECFLSQGFLQQADLMPLLQKSLPSIADNLSGLHFTAVFNILNYYLKDRFSFTRAIIAPKGAKTDFRDLFRGFAMEHESFSLEELAAFAKELQSSIYWESTFAGGAVRVSKTAFVNRSKITFDVEAADAVLESFCPGDYLPLQAVSSAMMMHLPSCGYSWNGYLLLSYVYGFSKVFQLSYNTMGKTGYYGAMVRRSCKEIDSYERLAERVLTDDDSWQTEEEALGLLVEKRLQAVKRLSEIDRIVAKARQNKLLENGR